MAKKTQLPIEIKVKTLSENVVLPTQATAFAGGFDIKVTEINDNKDYVICSTGLTMEIPEGYKLTIVPRSSLTKYNWYMPNSPAMIDSDYRGEIKIIFRCVPIINITENKRKFLHKGKPNINIIYNNFPFVIGDRIAQAYLEQVIPISFVKANELSITERGEGGFGSTGK